VRKPFEQRSEKFQWWAETKNRHNARWNFQGDGHFEHGHYIMPNKGAGIFGHCTHILSDAARIGNLFFQRYQFTLDDAWLRDRAYPVIRGAAEFYRTFPNVKKGEDGKFHIHNINNGESGWGSSDTPNEINGMRLAFANAIAASKILGADGEVRPKWQEMLDNLATPTNPGRGRRPATASGGDAGTPGGTDPSSTRPAATQLASTQRAATRPDGYGSMENSARRSGERPFGAFVYGGPGATPPNEPDAKLKARFLGFNALGSFIDPAGIGGPQIFRNRLRLREGPGAIDAEHIGGLTAGIHSTLLDSTPEENGQPMIEVFTAAWPRSWDCAFELLARGGFVASSSLKSGKIEFVAITSPLGGRCRMKNPWPGEKVSVRRADGSAASLEGAVLTFDTKKDESILLIRERDNPDQFHRPLFETPQTTPASPRLQ
jgi:hypothetical protein